MIVVTGGAGFIGSMLVKELNNRGVEDIIIVDRLRNQDKWKNLRGLRFSEFQNADEFFDNVQQYKGKITEIFHMGACSATTEKDADYLMKNNVEYSKKMFRLAITEKAKFVYASSAATYGDGFFGYDDNDEEMFIKLRPLNPYGYSKLCFDEWVRGQKEKPKHWFGLKFFNVYGPQEYHKGGMKSVVYHAYQQIQKEGKVKLFKSYHQDFQDGKQKRDFIYVKDVVNVMLNLCEVPSKESGIFNLGTGNARTFDDLARSVFIALDKPINIEYIEMPDHLKNQYQYFTEAQMDKLKRLLPDYKFMELEEGIADYVKNYLHTTDPYV